QKKAQERLERAVKDWNAKRTEKRAAVKSEEPGKDDEGVEPPDEWTSQFGEEIPPDTEVGPLMGQLPISGDKVSPAAQSLSVRYGSVTQTGLIVSIRARFYYSPAGIKALVRWLDERKFAGMYYSFAGYQDERR